MRGAGGPLLCIGDLLNDVGEGDDDLVLGSAAAAVTDTESESSSNQFLVSSSQSPNDLVHHFQEHYDRLNESLSGSDHSWTDLTLKLCTAVETANKLVKLTNSNAGHISEKVKELEAIVKRGDRAVAAAKALSVSLSKNVSPAFH